MTKCHASFFGTIFGFFGEGFAERSVPCNTFNSYSTVIQRPFKPIQYAFNGNINPKPPLFTTFSHFIKSRQTLFFLGQYPVSTG